MFSFSGDPFALRPDMRRMRATRLVALVMNIVSDHLPGDRKQHRDISRMLLEEFWKSGADIVTDSDREAAGLAPRGELGWTQPELVAMDEVRLKFMSRSPPSILAVCPECGYKLQTQVDNPLKTKA